MAPNPMLSARIDPSIIARIDRCADATNAAAAPGVRPHERGDVVRLLISRALPALEAELGIGTPARTRSAPGTRRTSTPGKVTEKGGKRASRKA
jgi:hypothetical protein